MADVYATKNGNWSDSTVWSSGSLPTVTDDVYANNKTVTLDQDITVLSLRTTAGTGITAGGTFNTPTTGTRNITANIIAGTSIVVNVNGTSTCNIIGNVTGGSASSSAVSVARYGAGYLLDSLPVATITGNIIGGTGAAAEGARLTGGTLTINGSVSGGTAGNSCSGLVLYNSENQPWNVTINGGVYGGTSVGNDANGLASQSTQTGPARTQTKINIVGEAVGGYASRNYGIGLGVNATITISVTGNITANTAFGFNARSVDPMTVVGNILAKGTHGINLDVSSGGMTVTGNITGGNTSNSWGIYNSNNCPLTINGNVYGGSAGSEPYGLNNQGNALNIINGNVFGGTGGSSCGGIRHAGTGTLIVNGSVYGASTGTGVSPVGAYNNTTGIFILSGSAIAGTLLNAHGVVNQSSGTLIVKRAVGNGYGPGSTGIQVAYGVVSNVQSAITRVEELEFGARGMLPVSGPGQIILNPLSSNIVNFCTPDGTRKTLTDPNATATYPDISDVRLGVKYAAGNLTGTCAVPSTSSVAFNIPVGNAVGTAVLTPNTIWQTSNNTLTATSLSATIGYKLNNVATTQVVGNLIAAYNS